MVASGLGRTRSEGPIQSAGSSSPAVRTLASSASRAVVNWASSPLSTALVRSSSSRLSSSTWPSGTSNWPSPLMRTIIAAPPRPGPAREPGGRRWRPRRGRRAAWRWCWSRSARPGAGPARPRPPARPGRGVVGLHRLLADPEGVHLGLEALGALDHPGLLGLQLVVLGLEVGQLGGDALPAGQGLAGQELDPLAGGGHVGHGPAHLLEHLQGPLVRVVEGLPRVLVLVEGLRGFGLEDRRKPPHQSHRHAPAPGRVSLAAYDCWGIRGAGASWSRRGCR